MATILVIGATGQVGRLVVEEALGRGLSGRPASCPMASMFVRLRRLLLRIFALWSRESTLSF